MNIDLTQWIVPTVTALTWVLCYLVGLWMEDKSKQKKVIPTIASCIGLIATISIQRTISVEVVLIGLVSGLAATGIDQAIKIKDKADKGE